jgi:hypothetical protein
VLLPGRSDPLLCCCFTCLCCWLLLLFTCAGNMQAYMVFAALLLLGSAQPARAALGTADAGGWVNI